MEHVGCVREHFVAARQDDEKEGAGGGSFCTRDYIQFKKKSFQSLGDSLAGRGGGLARRTGLVISNCQI